MTNGTRITKTELLGQIKRDRAHFDEIVARVPPDRLDERGLGGEGWSIKDVLWHIAWADRQGNGVIRAKALVGSDLWELSEDERNAAVVQEGATLSLEVVRGDYRQSYAEFISALEGLSDADLNDPERWTGFSERVPGWLPWRVLYDPDHYRLHGKWINDRL